MSQRRCYSFCSHTHKHTDDIKANERFAPRRCSSDENLDRLRVETPTLPESTGAAGKDQSRVNTSTGSLMKLTGSLMKLLFVSSNETESVLLRRTNAGQFGLFSPHQAEGPTFFHRVNED